MDAINALLEGLDFEGAMPDLSKLLANLPVVLKWAVLAGPVVVLVLGLIYLLVPPKEANHSLGFRTYFGMGSIEAWRFTQRVAGISLSVLGLVLTLVMNSITKSFAGMDHFVLCQKAVKCLLWELGLVAVFYLAISLTAAVFFDSRGDRRFGKKPAEDEAPAEE